MAGSERDEAVIEAFRAGEEPPGMHRDRLLLLTTTGRRSGQEHTTPVMVLPDESPGGALVVASANGSPIAPAWYLNLEAEPRVHVEVADDDYDATAIVLEGAERERVWAAILESAPFFAEHEERAGREIPVVRLTRA